MKVIFCSNKRWGGARNLAKLIGVLYPRKENAASAKPDVVVNWGSPPSIPWSAKTKVFNKAENIKAAVSKLSSLTKLKELGVPCLEFGTDASVLRAKHPESILVARTLTSSTGGKGIVIIRPEDVVVPAPLYTVYARKRAEYRVHVVGDETFIQQKKKKLSQPPEMTADQQLIRSHDNGWTFVVNNITATDAERAQLIALGKQAVKALGLDFGAVDIVQRRTSGKFLVCEVNTAPGISGDSTLGFYKQAMPKLYSATQASV